MTITPDTLSPTPAATGRDAADAARVMGRLLLAAAAVSPAASRLLVALWVETRGGSSAATIGDRLLAERYDLSRSRLPDARRDLMDAGVIEWVTGRRRGERSTYRIATDGIAGWPTPTGISTNGRSADIVASHSATPGTEVAPCESTPDIVASHDATALIPVASERATSGKVAPHDATALIPVASHSATPDAVASHSATALIPVASERATSGKVAPYSATSCQSGSYTCHGAIPTSEEGGGGGSAGARGDTIGGTSYAHERPPPSTSQPPDPVAVGDGGGDGPSLAARLLVRCRERYAADPSVPRNVREGVPTWGELDQRLVAGELARQRVTARQVDELVAALPGSLVSEPGKLVGSKAHRLQALRDQLGRQQQAVEHRRRESIVAAREALDAMDRGMTWPTALASLPPDRRRQAEQLAARDPQFAADVRERATAQAERREAERRTFLAAVGEVGTRSALGMLDDGPRRRIERSMHHDAGFREAVRSTDRERRQQAAADAPTRAGGGPQP